MKWLAGLAALVLLAGCAQNTEPVEEQSARARQRTSNEQEQQTAGTVINDNRVVTNNIYNGGPRGTQPSRGGNPSSQPLSLSRFGADTAQADDGGYTQASLTVSIAANTQTGGTAPSIGSGTASGTQTASPTQSQETTATQTPTVSVPVVFQFAMPGAAPQGSASGFATGPGGSGSMQAPTSQAASPNNAGQLSPTTSTPITVSIPMPSLPLPAPGGAGS